jgi:hypothetical protein
MRLGKHGCGVTDDGVARLGGACVTPIVGMLSPRLFPQEVRSEACQL